MDYYTLEQLRKHHPAWRLLNADHAPLIVSFLHRVFIEPNIRSYPQPELAQKLEDMLFHLNREAGERVFPRPAQSYLDDWALDTHAWLRKYYPPDGDAPHYDLTPAILCDPDRRPRLRRQLLLIERERFSESPIFDRRYRRSNKTPAWNSIILRTGSLTAAVPSRFAE